MKGRKSKQSIAQFKGQKSSCPEDGGSIEYVHSKSTATQVLLLLIQHGANGLNLLEAQHVILVEALLYPAAEAQAINRVHWVGQETKTFFVLYRSLKCIICMGSYQLLFTVASICFFLG